MVLSIRRIMNQKKFSTQKKYQKPTFLVRGNYHFYFNIFYFSFVKITNKNFCEIQMLFKYLRKIQQQYKP